jgi:hypothetical protein
MPLAFLIIWFVVVTLLFRLLERLYDRLANRYLAELRARGDGWVLLPNELAPLHINDQWEAISVHRERLRGIWGASDGDAETERSRWGLRAVTLGMYTLSVIAIILPLATLSVVPGRDRNTTARDESLRPPGADGFSAPRIIGGAAAIALGVAVITRRERITDLTVEGSFRTFRPIRIREDWSPSVWISTEGYLLLMGLLFAVGGVRALLEPLLADWPTNPSWIP